MQMDLRNIFGRAFNRGEEWTPGEGDNDSGWNGGPRRPELRLPKIPKLWLVIGLLFVLFSIVLPALAGIVTDYWWFQSHGYEAVFWRRFLVRWELFAAALVPAFLVYWLNWRFAWKSGDAELEGLVEQKSGPVSSRWLIPVVALLFALLNAFGAMDNWGSLLKFLYPTAFGTTDPLFHKDISFYIFSLPFYNFLQGWIQGLLFVSLVGSVIVYFLTKALTLGSGRFELPRKARLHLSLLGALILVMWGVGYWFERFDILYSPTGVVYGAGYTDVHIILPALSLLMCAAFAAAALLMVNFFKPMWKTSLIIIAVLLVAGWGVRSFIPSIVQQYRVKPNEYAMEKPYLGYSLEYTRRAFGLDKVHTTTVTPEAEVTPEEIKADQETVQDIRLWDYSPLLRTYKQLQAIRTYYNFADIYVDRYPIGGRNRQIMLAVRELDLGQLQNPTWVNTHLEFTHGYGVVMNPVNEVAPGGLPPFYMKDLPTKSTVDIPLNRPEIYYGCRGDNYVLVNTNIKEFDYPMGDANVRTSYAGKGGVKIDSLWRRLLFTLRFHDTEILFTGALKQESRMLMYRNVRESLAEIAPFLIYDSDTYPVLHDGRILWVQDCFTWSERYPYSNPVSTADRVLANFNGVNYIRNSVKATVDAYDGKMVFYVVDDQDPLVQTWSKIFPGLFRSGKEMPANLWVHMRYPEDFFEVQTDVYRTYHMTDTNTYYNREDVWEVTPTGRERRIQPNYVTMKLWGGKAPEFAIIVPYMPLGRDNLIGWMAGRCDPENYGQLLVYQFPKQKLIYGPAQVEALIDQNPEISAQLSLWSQRGSDVIRGDLLVIPVGKSLLYVQPLYLKAEQGELPELKRVIVSTGGRVAWAETFGEALEKLMGQKVVSGVGTQTVVTDEAKGVASVAVSADNVEPSANLVRRAQEYYDAAQKAQRSGDWAKYGEYIRKLGDVIARMQGGK